ncbi:hypothetical protein [Kitasatospora sp. NPDC098663]|uniref:hypothetical protein n=1 Tax=Kitasatospora sp. NPDC098663 TaxID=3364096 RepID=UPI003812FD9F
MDDDLTPADPAHPRAIPGHLAAALLLAAPRELRVDDHMFHPGPDLGPDSPSLRLQLFTAPRLRPVAVVTQGLQDGLSLTNAVECYAAAAWQRHCSDEDQPPLWVHRQLWTGRFAGRHEEVWELVTFAEAEPYQLRRPRTHTLTDNQREHLVGRPVDPGRGSRYVPRSPPAEPEPHFEVWPVHRLPRPLPFRQPACMPTGTPRWRRQLRQALPTRRVLSCCWYHAGNWHAVSALSLTVLDRARREEIPAREVATYAARQAHLTGASPWQRQALKSLFDLAIAIRPDEDGGYVNGQHRAQALMGARGRRIVVRVDRWPTASPAGS